MKEQKCFFATIKVTFVPVLFCRGSRMRRRLRTGKRETKFVLKFAIENILEYLEECGLASLPDGVDPVLVEAPWGGDWSVVVEPLPAVDAPVVVAVVVDVAVAVVGKAVLALLLGQGAVRALESKEKCRVVVMSEASDIVWLE